MSHSFALKWWLGLLLVTAIWACRAGVSPAQAADRTKPSESATARRDSESASSRIAPSEADVSYGPHERHVLDFWRADSASPAPLAVYIHGGGFRGGSKDSISQETLRELLDAGISVAAINYRLIDSAKLPAAHHDARRAVQFLRHEAAHRHLDPRRFAAFGGSAGAQISMWLAFHDDMAQATSQDPIERQSTRLSCVATFGGQATLDLDLWKQWVPGYDQPHRDPREVFGDLPQAERMALIRELAAIDLLSADDPPMFMQYAMSPDEPIPSDPRKAQNWKVHHVNFGFKLKERMDALGVPAHLSYPGSQTRDGSIPAFFRAELIEDGHAEAGGVR